MKDAEGECNQVLQVCRPGQHAHPPLRSLPPHPEPPCLQAASAKSSAAQTTYPTYRLTASSHTRVPMTYVGSETPFIFPFPRPHSCLQVERLCKDHKMRTLVDCLRQQSHELSSRCRWRFFDSFPVEYIMYLLALKNTGLYLCKQVLFFRCW